MKYSQQLKEIERQAPPVFKGSFVNYAGLKKFLKFRAKALGSNREGKAAVQLLKEADIEFLRMLAGQLREVDRRFEMESSAIIKKFDSMKAKANHSGIRSWRLLREKHRSQIDSQMAADLASRAAWCQTYARTNALALKKIAKKHDKVLGVHTGQRFVQACWRGEVAVKNFLSAPILSELAAVEALLKPQPGADAGHLSPVVSSPGETSGEDELKEEDLKCAICLDLMYLPVALECGHRFCARCVISVALGHDHAYGNVDSLLASGPVGCSEMPCPQCRATEHGVSGRGVFFNAKRLPHVDLLIQSRYPEEWERRKQEEAEEQAALKEGNSYGLKNFFHRHAHA